MAEKLFIADKKTLDEVNKKLDSFSGGTDWSKYTILNKFIKLKSEPQKEYISCFEIRGKGFFNECYAGYYNNSDYGFLKIVVDDNIILESKTHNSENCIVGLTQLYNKDPRVVENAVEFPTGNINDCQLTSPIFFNKKFEVFAKSEKKYGQDRIFDYICFRGGIEK